MSAVRNCGQLTVDETTKESAKVELQASYEV